ncbi:MAG: hypothetical protein ACLRS8_13720 [Parabacteroides merdae]
MLYKELVYQNLVAEANGLPLPNNEEEDWNMQKHMIIMLMISVWQESVGPRSILIVLQEEQKGKILCVGQLLSEKKKALIKTWKMP